MNAVRSLNTSYSVADNSSSSGLANAGLTVGQGAINAVASLSGLLSGNYGSIISGVASGVNTYLDYQKNINSLNTDLTNSRLSNSTNYQNTIASLMASVEDAKVQPNTARGDTSVSGVDVSRGTSTFLIKKMGIDVEHAEIIDMYLSVYGYKVNKFGYPDLTSREEWNYIKTVDCHLIGTCPFDDLQGLEDLYNNGLTIWHKADHVLNYSLNNPIKEN